MGKLSVMLSEYGPRSDIQFYGCFSTFIAGPMVFYVESSQISQIEVKISPSKDLQVYVDRYSEITTA